MTNEQLNKLPKWAQDEFKNIRRERDEAVRLLDEWTNDQTPSPFSLNELCCTGEKGGPTVRKRYVQANRLDVRHAGVRLTVSLSLDDRITLNWGEDNETGSEVAMVPHSYMRVDLLTAPNLRTFANMKAKGLL